MIAEVNLFGLFFDVALITALVAGAALAILHRLLSAIGAYRWVWHPRLFDLALFALLWFALAIGASRFDGVLVNLIG
jgi:hypothetical protein